jgi:hypothetical protein
MLKWDSPEQIKGLTVFTDDEDWTKVYVLPSTPRFRLDENNNPVFKFLKYKFPIDRPGGVKGGGFLVCDAEFGVSEKEEQAVKEELKPRIEARWHAEGRQGPAPDASIGRMNFLRGTASVQILDSGGALVQKVTNPGSPSLYGKMILPITVELSPEGATLLESALQDKGGIVQVVYDIWTPVRLPPVEVTVWFQATKFMQFHQEIDVEENFCAEDDYTEKITELVTHTDYGGTEFKWGNVTDEKIRQPIRDWANKTLADATARMILGDVPMQNPEQMRKLYTEQDFENITQDVMSTRLVSFNRTYKENMVMEWNPQPRGTLPNITSMTGPNGEKYKWEDFSKVVDLDDPFFRTLSVTTRANADFERLPLHSIEVKIEYQDGADLRVGEFVLDKPESVGVFNSFVSNNNRNYTYSYQVNYKGEAQPFVSERTESNETSLIINVGDTGILDLDILKGDMNFEQVKFAQVSLWYEDDDVQRIETSVTIDKEHDTHNWTKVIFSPQRKPVHYTVKYFMNDGREFTASEQTVGAKELRINDPFSSIRTVNIRGFGDFDNRIDTIFVDLKYVDELNAFTQTFSTALNKESTFGEWKFPAILQDGGKLTYTGTIRFKDGTVQTIEETPIDGASVMLGDVQLEQPITVLADLVDWTKVKLVKVTMVSETDVEDTEDLIFKQASPTPLTWRLPYKDKNKKRAYSYRAQYFPISGSPKDVVGTTTTEESVVLPETAG